MIGLLSRFLTSHLHYSIASPSLPSRRRCFRSRRARSAPRFHSRVQVSICFRSLSLYLTRLSLSLSQNASAGCRRGETLDSQIIESNSGGQFLSVSRSLPPSSFAFVPFGIRTLLIDLTTQGLSHC